MYSVQEDGLSTGVGRRMESTEKAVEVYQLVTTQVLFEKDWTGLIN
jgi:hypothetical protein